MARPRKTGLDYFPLDTVLDDRVQYLEELYGNDGFAFYVKTLQLAYQTDNGELGYSDIIRRRIAAKRANLTEKRFMQILETAVEIGLFEQSAWFTRSVLTSNGIRKRIDSVSAERASARARVSPPLASPPKIKTKEEKSKVKVKGNPPLFAEEPPNNKTQTIQAPIVSGCSFFKATPEQLASVQEFYDAQSLPQNFLALAIQTVDAWMSKDEGAGFAARKTGSNYLQLRASWVIENTTKIIESKRKLNGTPSKPQQFQKHLSVSEHNEQFFKKLLGGEDEQDRNRTIIEVAGHVVPDPKNH